MANECGAQHIGVGTLWVCVRPTNHLGDHKSASGGRWVNKKVTKASIDAAFANIDADLRRGLTSKKAQQESLARTIAEVKAVEDAERNQARLPKTPEAWTTEDVIANIKDRLSIRVNVCREDYDSPAPSIRVQLRFDGDVISEESATLPTE